MYREEISGPKGPSRKASEGMDSAKAEALAYLKTAFFSGL
jgi:hypothetical protein